MFRQGDALPPQQLCRQQPAPSTVRPVWTKDPKEGGGAGEGRPEQKVRTGREFKEMFLPMLPSMGVSTPVGRGQEVGTETG